MVEFPSFACKFLLSLLFSLWDLSISPFSTRKSGIPYPKSHFRHFSLSIASKRAISAALPRREPHISAYFWSLSRLLALIRHVQTCRIFLLNKSSFAWKYRKAEFYSNQQIWDPDIHEQNRNSHIYSIYLTKVTFKP